jgi:hypothetical protein
MLLSKCTEVDIRAWRDQPGPDRQKYAVWDIDKSTWTAELRNKLRGRLYFRARDAVDAIKSRSSAAIIKRHITLVTLRRPSFTNAAFAKLFMRAYTSCCS